MKANRHVYNDFPDFTQEVCYEVTSKVTFQNGVKDEVKTTIVCDDAYAAMKMVREFLLSKKDWLVTEVHGQSYECCSLLVGKLETSRLKYIIICDSINYDDGNCEEIKHYSVIHTIPNKVATIYHGIFDTEKLANEYCAKFNKKWEEYSIEGKN